jgi:hypothetical protein
MTFHPKKAALAGAAFLIGLLTQTSVNVVGNMPLAEFVVLAVVAVTVATAAVGKHISAALFRMPLFWVFAIAQIVAFTAYVASDISRGSAANDMLRGWSRMIFLGVDIVAITWLFGAAESCFLWLQAGLMCGGLLATILEGAQFDAYWKFGLGGPATVALLLVSPFFGRLTCIVLVGAMGVVHLALDFRSMGGVCLLVAILLSVLCIPRQFRAFLLVPAIIGGTVFTFWLNSQQRAGDDGRASRSTVERTAMYVAAWEGFAESPLIGQGSWFSNSRVLDNFQLLRSEGARLAGVHGYAVETEETAIAIHSQFLVSIAEGGIFGGTFFLVFGTMLMWSLWYCTVRRDADTRTPIFIFFLLNALWNLLFSPFSGAHRIGIATGCGLIFLLWREAHGTAAAESEPEPAEENQTELCGTHS